MTEPRIELAMLTSVPVEEVVALLNEPRNARHMPLAGEPFTLPAAAAWVAAKDAQWAEHGYGPWAVMVDERFVGWGGFQREEAGADLGLVLAPAHWGLGAAVARRMLRVGFEELGLEDVLVALPHSRTSPDRALARWGFTPEGETVFGDVVFRQYRLSARDWRATLGGR